MPKQAITDNEIISCFSVVSELRPHLTKDNFLPLVRSMEKAGYVLAFETHEGEVAAVAGYRINTNLFMGKHLYVDDLVTRSSLRSKGLGETMINWLREIAVQSGCAWFHLDSGVQRGGAHKFYFEQGLTIASYHFSERL